MEISQIASFVDSSPIQMLRRAQLWAIADKHGIKYPHDATKDQMIMVLEGAGVDVTQSENGIDWIVVRGKDEHGHANSYVAPVIPIHQSARSPEESDVLASQEKERLEQSEEVEELRAENEQLKGLLARVEALERTTLPMEKMVPWQLKQMAKSFGCEDTRNMTKDELIAFVRERQ